MSNLPKYTPKYVLSLSLSTILMICPLLYAPHGGIGEQVVFGLVFILVLVYIYGLTQSRTLAQSSREKRGQLSIDNLFNLWMWGGWIALGGAICSLIPLPWSLVEISAPKSYKAWHRLFELLDISEHERWMTLSVSPANSWRWSLTQLCWLMTVYCTAQVRGVRKPLLWSLVFLGPCLSLIALVHLLTETSLIYGFIQPLDRVDLSGFITPLINPNHAASLMMLSAFISVGMTQSLVSENLTRSTHQLKVMLGGLSVLLCTIGLYFTQSRAAWVIYISFMSVWFCRHRLTSAANRYLVITISLFIGVILPLILILAVDASCYGPLDTIKAGTWSASIPLIFDYFPMGSGRGSFGEVFTQYQTFDVIGWISEAENFFIQTLSEGGLVGLLSLIFNLLAWWAWWKTPNIKDHPVAFSIGLGVTAIGLHQQYDFGVEHSHVAVIFAIAWGLMWSYQPRLNLPIALGQAPHLRKRGQKRSQRYRGHKNSPWSKNIVQMIVLLSVYLFLFAYVASNESSVRQESDQFDRHQRRPLLLSAMKSHPLSAHLAVRFARDEETKRLEWISHSRRLAPRWSSSLFLEARLQASLGLDEQAAITYRLLLKRDLRQRDRVFNDLFARPLQIAEVTWMPKKHWYSYYIQLKQKSATKAQTFLMSMPRDQVASRVELRGLWIRYLIPICKVDVLSSLKEYAKRLESSSEGGADQEKTWGTSQYEKELLEIDLSILYTANHICSPQTSEGAGEYLVETGKSRGVEGNRGDVMMKKRKKVGDLSLEKAKRYMYLRKNVRRK